MKGTPLAYTHYARPWLRPRSDVDLLVAACHVGRAKSLLIEMGYQSPTELPGDTLTNELTFVRSHEGTRDIDLHWKTCYRPSFSNVISFDTLMESSIPIESLYPSARSPKPLHSLLIACMHRVHHQNSDKLLWLYDIHLIAERLSEAEAEEFVEIAKRKKVWTICARSVEISASRFLSSIPDPLRAELKSSKSDVIPEPSASYLNSGPWHTRVTDVRTLPSWRERVHALQEMAFPRRAYVRDLYREHPVTPLPLLYLDRLARGAVRMLRHS